MAWDAPRKRLYVTLSNANGVAAFDVDLSGAAPSLTPTGTFATAWWPTSVVVDKADGALYVTSGKGRGTVGDGAKSVSVKTGLGNLTLKKQ